MELSYGFLAYDRFFSKAMSRASKSFIPMLGAFKALNIEHTDCRVILVGIVGTKSPDHFEFLGNNEGQFQLSVGISETGTDQEVALAVYHILLKAVRFYPFTREEHAQIEALFEKHRPNLASAPEPNEK